LANPSEVDITAHVDFTAFAESALTLGCQIGRFRNQGAWLTETGREWLLSLEGKPDMDFMRQFQTLTHPSHLGGSFHVIELHWQKPTSAEIVAEDSHRLALCACPTAKSE
jgi:SAM-dependent MidA family methyltransferase